MAYSTETPITHIDHLRYLNDILAYADVTHIGDPDSHLLSPCSIHGYRVIYSARPKLDWTRPMTGHSQGQAPTRNVWWGDNRYAETVWQWSDSRGGDRPEWFTHQQRNNQAGSWVLVSGATGGQERNTKVGQNTWTGGDTPPPTDATSKWWVTSQNDLTSPQAENPGGVSRNLVGWSRENQNSTRGLGTATGLPQSSQILEGGAYNVWWILYGEREILGFTECTEDHIHGHEKNWSASQLNDPNIFNPTMAEGTTSSSSQGGMLPHLVFFGGDIHGAQAKPIVNHSTGEITGATITDPGTTVITDGSRVTAPSLTISMPDHYSGFEATAQVTTDAARIKELYPQYFKSSQEIRAALSDGYVDPLAQTFMVPAAYDDGVFLDSIDLCFGNKPNMYGPPVYIELRPTVNGFPSSDHVIKDTVVAKSVGGVNVADANENTSIRAWENPLNPTTRNNMIPSFNDADSYTRFKFKHPIYLKGDTEYAIIVRSAATQYECWYADTNGIPVRNLESISNADSTVNQLTGIYAKQYQGTFFRSHNGRTWTENQEQDLMFRINKCVWQATRRNPNTATVEMRAGDKIGTTFNYDRMKLVMSGINAPGGRRDSDITSEISLTPSGGELTNYSTYGRGDLMGDDSNEVIHDLATRMEVTASKEIESAPIKAKFTLRTYNKHISPVIDATETFILPIQNVINNGGLAAKDINVLTVGAGYTAGETITFTVGGGGSTSNAEFTIVTQSGETFVDRDTVTVTIPGAGFHIADNISVSQLTGTDPSTTAATFEILSEECVGRSGTAIGNSDMAYETKVVNLAPEMSARGIRVYLSALVPAIDSKIYVYYKVKSESDSQEINKKKWRLMEQTIPESTEYSSSIYRTFQFDSDDNITYEATNDGTGETQTFSDFKSFQIKIACQAGDTTKPPIIRDFRAIAVY